MTTSLKELDQYLGQPLPAGYPTTQRHLYAPLDQVHGALLHLINAARTSLVIAMYALTDRELADAVRAKMADPHVDVQLTLDASQAIQAAEQQLLAVEQFPATSVAIVNSEHGSLMHMKACVIDGHILLTGSTNWSHSGQYLQDNDLIAILNSYVCARARARLDAIHALATPPSQRR